MKARFSCPNCKWRFLSDRELIGATIRCYRCGSVFVTTSKFQVESATIQLDPIPLDGDDAILDIADREAFPRFKEPPPIDSGKPPRALGSKAPRKEDRSWFKDPIWKATVLISGMIASIGILYALYVNGLYTLLHESFSDNVGLIIAALGTVLLGGSLVVYAAISIYKEQSHKVTIWLTLLVCCLAGVIVIVAGWIESVPRSVQDKTFTQEASVPNLSQGQSNEPHKPTHASQIVTDSVSGSDTYNRDVLIVKRAVLADTIVPERQFF